MAIMIPRDMEEDNHSLGERKVFQALKEKLPNEYYVFHSVRWNTRNEKRNLVYGECDFTVLHKVKGMIVIEVKSGGIECNNNQWNYIRTDNNEKYPMKNPLKQADKSKYKFAELIEDLFEDELTTEYCYVDSAVWFPSISKRDIVGELPMEFNDTITLYENALDNPLKFIDGIYEYFGGKRHTSLSQPAFDKLIDAMAPHYAAMPSLKSKRELQQELFERLTTEQKSLIDYLEEQRVAAIQGAAGTGKTMLAVEKAKSLSKTGKVLFLCFNQFLKEYLQGLKEESPKEFEGIDFNNLQGLTCSKLRVPYVEKPDILQFLDNFENYDWDYTHIVIDEGQDFDDEQITKLNDIALCLDGAFYIFYDKNQFVQGREFPEWLKNAECRLVLNINCRNTFSIAETSGKVVGVEPKVKKRSVVGDMPKFHICATNKDVQKKMSVLIDQYRNNGYAYDQIVILSGLSEEQLNSSDSEMTNKSVLAGVEKVGNHKISTRREPNSVLFTTVRKFKGLEADVIIMVDVDENTFANEESKRLFYVGTSRAKHFLDIVYQGDNEGLSAIAEEVFDKSVPTPILGIARGLNVKPEIK